MIRFAYLFIISILLASCNCHFEGNGYIYDQKTKKPMAGVRIDVHSTKPWKDTLVHPIYTDSQGYFEYSHDFCYDMMTAAIPNYINHSFSDIKGDTLYLENLEGDGVTD